MPSTLLISPIVMTGYITMAWKRFSGTVIDPAGDPEPDGSWVIWSGASGSILPPLSAEPTVIASNDSPNGWTVTFGSAGLEREWIGARTGSPPDVATDYHHYSLGINVTPPSGWDCDSGFGIAVFHPFHVYGLHSNDDTSVTTPYPEWWQNSNYYHGWFNAPFTSFYIYDNNAWAAHQADPDLPLNPIDEVYKNTTIRLLARNGLNWPEYGLHFTTTALLSDNDPYKWALLGTPYTSLVGSTFTYSTEAYVHERLATPSVTASVDVDWDDGTTTFQLSSGDVEQSIFKEYHTIHAASGLTYYGTNGTNGYFDVTTTHIDNYGRTSYAHCVPQFGDTPPYLMVMNRRPVAVAAACVANPDGTIHLDGTASTDADNDPLRYQWYLRCITPHPAGPYSYMPWTDAVLLDGEVWLRVGLPSGFAGAPYEGSPYWFRLTDTNGGDVDTSTFGYREVGVFPPVDTLIASTAIADVAAPPDDGNVYVFILKVRDNEYDDAYTESIGFGSTPPQWINLSSVDRAAACVAYSEQGHPISALTEPLGPIYAAMQVGSDIQVIREPGGGYTTRENLALLENYKHPTIYRSGDSSRLYLLARNSDAVWDLFSSDDSGATFTLMAQPFGGDASYKKVRGGHGFAEGGGAATAIKGGTVWYTHSWDNVNWSEPVDTEIISDIAADVHQQSEAGSARLVIFAQNATYYSLTADGLPLPNGDSAWVELT